MGATAARAAVLSRHRAIWQDVGVAGLLGAVLVIVALAALIYVSVRPEDLARVEVADGALVVRARGLNRLWALRAQLRIPLSEVSHVRRDVARETVPSGLRMPGTYVPGLVQAGTYRRGGERSFWLVGRTRKVTVIECPGSKVDRIVLQLSDETAAGLAAMVRPGRVHPAS